MVRYRSQEMALLLERWRARRRVRDLPAPPLGADPAGPVTTAVMAEVLEVSMRHYQRLESGERRMSSDTIAAISRVLSLHPDEMQALYRWAGRPVPLLLSPTAPDVPEDLADHIRRLPFPALVEAPDFGILAVNRRAERACPWTARPGANVMVDLLLPGPGRDQCAQWAEHWAPPLLAQLRQGALGNAALRAIVDRVREDPQVRDLWERTADLRSHAYGTTRPMHLEGASTPAWVRILGWKPLHEPSLRVITGEPGHPPAGAEAPKEP